MLNKSFKLSRYPKGMPAATDWHFSVEEPRNLAEGEVLIESHYLSIDPAMRGWLTPGKSYLPMVRIGEVMRAAGVGQVLASKDPNFHPGDFVSGLIGIQQYPIVAGDNVTKIDIDIGALPKHLSLFGITGLTAYFGLLCIGEPKPGETVVVSSAAGAVGSVVGQIAKIRGCRVVGIAGGKRKCSYVADELHFDACIDYRRGPIFPGLAKYCPAGVDVYFDNVGGDILDAVLTRLNRRGRVIVCGAISQINNTAGASGPKNYMSLLVNSARMEGFVVSDFRPDYPSAIQQLAKWFNAGALKSDEDVQYGITAFPDALSKLFSGNHLGKLMLHVKEDGPVPRFV